MYRLAVAVVFLFCALCALGQTRPTSDQLAITLAQQSISALTDGTAINDTTLNANVTSILGADHESGSATLRAKGINESRIDLSLNTSGVRSDVRNVLTSGPAGAWSTNGGPATAYTNHNCWVDAVWFFPELSSLSQTANPNFVFKYIGLTQHGAVNAQHIQIFQWSSQDATIPHLSTMDFYLDPVSSLPLAIDFKVHSDSDMNVDIPVEIGFANYQRVSGVQVPFHIQRMLNGGVVLDATLTSATLNGGLADTLFSLH